MKNPATLSGVIPKERGDGSFSSPSALPSRNRGVYFGHGISVGEINATLSFSSLSLRVSVVRILLCFPRPIHADVGTVAEAGQILVKM